MDDLKKQIFIHLFFWRLDVQNQGVSQGCAPSEGYMKESFLFSSWWLLTSLGAPWLSSPERLPCLHLLKGALAIGFRDHSNPI